MRNLYVIIPLFWVFPMKVISQTGLEDTCSLISQIKMRFGTHFSLVNKSHMKVTLLLNLYKDSILSLTKDSNSYRQLLNYLSIGDSAELIWWSDCSQKTNIISQRNFEDIFNGIKHHKRKNKYRKAFPIVSTSKPFLFNNNSFCLIGICFYQTASTATYGYYLFEKKYDEWLFRNTIFEMVK